MPNVQAEYTLRFPKSDGGFIEYVFNSIDNTVSSPAVATPGTMTLENVMHNLDLVSSWRDSIYRLFTLASKVEPDLNAECNLEIKVNTIRAKPQAGSFRLDFTFDKSTKMVTATARPPFTVTWAGFLFVYSQLHTFVKVCRGDWSNQLTGG